MTILGADISHFQGNPNFGLVKASGREFVVLKATESTNYADPTLAVNRRNAHAAGLIVGMYHFARAGNAAAEAAYFLRTIGALQTGEFLVLDWEVSGSNPPAWCKAWLDAIYAATGVRPLIYMNQSAASGSNWSAVAASYGLWLAKYDQSTAQPSVAGWPAVAMKQFYDKGVVPGIAGGCDVDVFFGTRDQLLAYGAGGQDNDMTPDQAKTLDNIAWLIGQIKPSVDDVHGWLRGGDKDHDNITLIWEMLRGGNPDGKNNFNWVVDQLTAAFTTALAQVQPGAAVDAAEVAKLVLAGLNGAQLNVTQPAKS